MTEKELANPSAEVSVRAALNEGYGNLRAYIMKKVSDKTEAEEILQAFCMRALEKAKSVTSGSSARSWLAQVLRSTIADYFRAKARRTKREMAVEPTFWDEVASPEAGTNAEEAICACLRSLMKVMRQEDANLIDEVDLMGASREQAASSRAISINALNVRLHRARTRLQALAIQFCAGCTDHGVGACECPIPNLLLE